MLGWIQTILMGLMKSLYGLTPGSGGLQFGAAGASLSRSSLTLKKTGLADTVATAILTVTIPNGNHAAVVKLIVLGTSGGADAFESSRLTYVNVVFTRTLNVAAAAGVSNTLSGIATVASGAAVTAVTITASAPTGANTDPQTIDVRVAVDDSGNLGGSQVIVQAELFNAENSGITMVAV